MNLLSLLLSLLLLAFGLIASVIDIKTKTIPNKLVLLMLSAWLVVMIPMVIFRTSEATVLLKDSALGFALAGGLFLLVYIISKKGLGGGDVKFMAVCGLYLGLYYVVPVIFIGSILAGLTGLTMLLLKKMKRKDTLPLAPFLYVGILLTISLTWFNRGYIS